MGLDSTIQIYDWSDLMIDTQNCVVNLDLDICQYAFSLEHRRLNKE